MERTANIPFTAWPNAPARSQTRTSVRSFALVLVATACLSAVLASWLPLQVSIVTGLLLAAPHNWFELRYFLMRLPARFDRSRTFFALPLASIFFLTGARLSMAALHSLNPW